MDRITLALLVLLGSLLLTGAGGFIGRWLCSRKQLREIDRLHEEIEAFLHEGKGFRTPVDEEPLSLIRGDLVALSDVLSRARQAKEETARRSAVAIADISHQLKTPIAGMRLLCELEVEDRIPRAEKQLALIERMDTLVRELLKIEKLDANAFSMHFAPTDLRSLCLAQGERFRAMYPKRRISCTGEPLLVRVDASWMEEAIGNILKNACEHTSDTGQIQIALSQGEGFAWVRISDDGGGVPPEQLPALFARFSRVGTQVGGGTGLGLAIVRSIVERHHGAVYAENACGGLRISIALPVMADQLIDMSAE